MIATESAGALLALALVDSLSFGTLLVPVWLLLAPRLRAGRIALYLAIVAATYFAIGIALVAGGKVLSERLAELFEATPMLIVQLAFGATLLVLSFALDTKAARARASARGGGRIARWRDKTMGDGAGVGALIALAVTAVLIEAASMLPYLAATGIIAAQTTGAPEAGVVLAAYCLVMIAPALLLAGGRMAARQLLEAPLVRIEAWMSANARGATLWIIGIAGFFIAGAALNSLGWVGS